MSVNLRDIDLVYLGYAKDLDETSLRALSALSKVRLAVDQPLKLAFVINGAEQVALPLSINMHMYADLDQEPALCRAKVALNFSLPNESAQQRHTRCLKLISAGAVLVAEEDAQLKGTWSEGGCLLFKSEEDLVPLVLDVLRKPEVLADLAEKGAKILKAELCKESDKLNVLGKRSEAPQSIFAPGSGALSKEETPGLAAGLRKGQTKTKSSTYARFLEGIKAAKRPSAQAKEGKTEDESPASDMKDKPSDET